jgi:hypothetical protein
VTVGQLAKPLVQPLLVAKCGPLNFYKQMIHPKNFLERSHTLISAGKIFRS